MQKWTAIRRLADVSDIEQALLQRDAPKKYKTLDEVLEQVRQFVAARDERQQSVKLQMIYRMFPEAAPAEWETQEKKRDIEIDLMKQWDVFMANGGARALRDAQELHPDMPEPRDPRAALLMILTPPTTPDQAALKTLDYLDKIVQCDPNAVSHEDETQIQLVRSGIENDQLGGEDPRKVVGELADRIIAEGVRRFRQRLLAIKPRLDERVWKVQVEEAVMPLLLTGKLVDSAEFLHRLEQMAN